jgi:hypothetical protein
MILKDHNVYWIRQAFQNAGLTMDDIGSLVALGAYLAQPAIVNTAMSHPTVESFVRSANDPKTPLGTWGLSREIATAVFTYVTLMERAKK